MDKHYEALYTLQDEVLSIIASFQSTLYLSGGTALSRFYLEHRYSDDLDLFTHEVNLFADTSKLVIHALSEQWPHLAIAINSRDFKRIVLSSGSVTLKIDLVADRLPRIGLPQTRRGFLVDSIRNIASNKIGAIMGRDEGRDIVDLWYIARSRRFSWKTLLDDAARKEALEKNELVYRLETFPLDLVEEVPLFIPLDPQVLSQDLERMADDLAHEAENSLAAVGTPLLNEE